MYLLHGWCIQGGGPTTAPREGHPLEVKANTTMADVTLVVCPYETTFCSYSKVAPIIGASVTVDPADNANPKPELACTYVGAVVRLWPQFCPNRAFFNHFPHFLLPPGAGVNTNSFKALYARQGSFQLASRVIVPLQSTLLGHRETHHNAGSSLTSTLSTPGSNGTLACFHDSHSLCKYFIGDGGLTYGSVAAAASDGTASSSTSNKMSPVVIALLAMNGFLVMGVFVLAGIWHSDRRSGSGSTAPRRYKEVKSSRKSESGPYDESLTYNSVSRMNLIEPMG
ncbi:hypothetical protein FB451DRAFT_1480507 [Mycena latifolia]|nr:hypothetical protein FB451DRAFT_1480507 [Mycena latifolia]